MNRDAKQVLTELLVIKAQGGDSKAFKDLHALFAGDVLKLSSFLLRQTEAAKDVSQEVWVGVARGLHRLDNPSRFRGWLFCIVRRRCYDWIEHARRERNQKQILEERYQTESGSDRKLESDASVDLGESIQKLDTESRLLLHLFYTAGLGVREVAEAMNLPAGTVKSRLYAIREKLKRHIERKRP